MKFLICERCLNWTDEERFTKQCHECKDKRIIKHPESQLCNKCGQNLCPPEPNVNWKYPDGLVDALVIGSYDSTHLLDLNAYCFSLCELCLRNMFNECVIPPIVYSDNDKNKISYSEDKIMYEHSQWRKNGGYLEAYNNRKCNTIKDCPNEAKYSVLHNKNKFSESCVCEEHSSTYSNATWYKLVPFISKNLKAFL